MQVSQYNFKMQCTKIWKHQECPSLVEIFPKAQSFVLAFDQSTTATGITIATDGKVACFLRCIRNNSKMKGIDFVADFQEWLPIFLNNANITHLLHEDIFSRGYYNSDKILASLKSTFSVTKRLNKHTYPITCVKQQIWKSTLFSDYNGSHALTKENVQDALHEKTGIPIVSYLEDLYDSLGIYNYYCAVLKDSSDTTQPIRVGTALRYSYTEPIYTLTIGKDYTLPTEFDRILKNRKSREFIYNPNMSLEEVTQRLVSNTNKICYGSIPLDSKYIVPILWETGRFPNEELGEKIWLTCYRKNKKVMDNEL